MTPGKLMSSWSVSSAGKRRMPLAGTGTSRTPFGLVISTRVGSAAIPTVAGVSWISSMLRCPFHRRRRVAAGPAAIQPVPSSRFCGRSAGRSAKVDEAVTRSCADAADPSRSRRALRAAPGTAVTVAERWKLSAAGVVNVRFRVASGGSPGRPSAQPAAREKLNDGSGPVESWAGWR